MTNKPPETPPVPELLSQEEIEDVLRRLISATKRDQSDIQRVITLGNRSAEYLNDAHKKINKILVELAVYRVLFLVFATGFFFLVITRSY